MGSVKCSPEEFSWGGNTYLPPPVPVPSRPCHGGAHPPTVSQNETFLQVTLLRCFVTALEMLSRRHRVPRNLNQPCPMHRHHTALSVCLQPWCVPWSHNPVPRPPQSHLTPPKKEARSLQGHSRAPATLLCPVLCGDWLL